jgi:hypothetical protein
MTWMIFNLFCFGALVENQLRTSCASIVNKSVERRN